MIRRDTLPLRRQEWFDHPSLDQTALLIFLQALLATEVELQEMIHTGQWFLIVFTPKSSSCRIVRKTLKRPSLKWETIAGEEVLKPADIVYPRTDLNSS